MSTRFVLGVSILTVVVGAFVWSMAPTAVADDLAAVRAVALPAATVADDKYEYVGDSKCKMCHVQQHKSWRKTRMGNAFDTLKPGAAADAKKAHGMDPEKDYTRDETCLACHTTGFGKAGGYAVPDPNDKAAVKLAKKRRNVGCESCHGPGSAYIDVFMNILMTKRKYKVEELYAVGLTKIDESTCTVCHNDKSPTFDATTGFDFDEMSSKREQFHELVPLKQREE